MINKIKCLNSLFLLSILLKFSQNYIVIPFKSTNHKLNITYDDSPDFIDKFMKELDKSKIYAVLPIGKPKKETIVYFTMIDYFGILKNICFKGMISSYNPYESKSFTYDPQSTCTYYDLFKAKLGNDNVSLYYNIKMNDYFAVNFNFLIANQTYWNMDDYEIDKYCGKIGLIKRGSYPNYYSNFIEHLKKSDIISSYQWGIFYFDKELSYYVDKDMQNKYDGFYIAGLTDDDYLNIFNMNYISNTYIEMPLFTMLGGKFDQIYFKYKKEKINCSIDTYFENDIDANYIISKKNYFEKITFYFFKIYINKGICIMKNSTDKYSKGEHMIICDLTFKNDLKNFPKLYLFYRELNFTFSLDYKDLFIEINDKIYFLIIYRELSDSVWNFGNILVKKYSFMYDQDKKQIYFIHLKKYELEPKDDEDEDITKDKNNFWSEYKESIIIGVLVLFIIIAAIVGFVFGRKIWEKHRKLRANELDDNYDYTKEIDNEKLSKIMD